MATHIVEVFVKGFGTGANVNNVAVVAPAALTIADGDAVIFHNKTGGPIRLWFPRDWSSDLGENEASHDIEDNAIKGPWRMDAAKIGPEGEVQYQVYSALIHEFAVGDSPPRMKLPPPGP